MSEREARDFGIRYVELLRAIYPAWDFGQEKMDENFDIVEVNLNQAPHNIKLSLARDERDGRSMWRISMALGWDRESREWDALACTKILKEILWLTKWPVQMLQSMEMLRSRGGF